MTSPDRQAEQPRGTQPEVPEALGIGNLIWAHPRDLMRENPAALIVNTESYNRIDASFSVDQFDPPQVVRVKAYSSESQEVTRMFVVDGHTRTKYAADHPDIIVAAFRFESIPVRDVTASQLRSPIVVPESERQNNQQALTMVQYLRAVIPPTIEHSQIAPDRIAAHLINGWRNMVGEELASKFSAIAALSLLENPAVPIATDSLLNRFLSEQAEIRVGETPDERTRLQKALLEIASIIRQTKLFREKIAESAFILVASGSSVIGGERESLKEIYGLLHTPLVERKLVIASGQTGERERVRSQLGQLIVDTFKRFAQTPNKEQDIAVVKEALNDPNLNLGQLNEVLTAPLPSESYVTVRQEINLDKLRQAYLTSKTASQLTETETILVTNLGRKTFLTETEVPTIVRLINNAVQNMSQTQQYIDNLTAKKTALLTSGVKEQTIDEAITVLVTKRETIKDSTSIQMLSVKIKALTDALSDVDKKIKREIGIYKIGKIVDEVYGDKLQEGFGPQVRTNIIFFVLRETDALSDERIIRQRATQLKSLDSDLQSRVLSGEIRLIAANRIQHDRKLSPNRNTQRTMRNSSMQVPPNKPSPSPNSPPHQNRIDDDQVTGRMAEERRKTTNNDRLSQGLGSLNEVLSNLDLDQDEIKTENLTSLNDILRQLGKIRFNHPDVVRIIEDYQRHLQEETQEREAQLAREREETDRDTRTQR